ncbi:MAG: hypothetical protein DCC71_22330, partial [Proteobacteria bacterium]
LFRVLIAQATRVQERGTGAADAPELELAGALRPAISALGDRLVATLAHVAPLAPATVDAGDWAPLAPWLDERERAELRAALLAVRRAD